MSRWKRHPQRYGGPWYGNDFRRAVFERGVRRHFPALRASTRTSGERAGRLYQAQIDVPHFERRRVEAFFSKQVPLAAQISADGPEISPHRYEDGKLCIWYPGDPDSDRWVHSDGLLMLLGLITAHLFREAWWRQTGEWLGLKPDIPDRQSPVQKVKNVGQQHTNRNHSRLSYGGGLTGRTCRQRLADRTPRESEPPPPATIQGILFGGGLQGVSLCGAAAALK